MALQFLGKTAIITGGGGALGRSYALEFAKRGCNVIVNDVGSSLSGVAGAASNDPAGECFCLSGAVEKVLCRKCSYFTF